MENNNLSIYDDDYLKSKIYIIRGVQVMLDADFRFQLTDYEYKNLISIDIKTGRYMQTTVCIHRNNGLHQTEFDDFKNEYPNVDITLKTTGGIYHDRYIFIDSGTKNEMIFHCGGSSKDGGRRVSSITKVEDVMLFKIS